MTEDEVRQRAFAMPLTSPAYPKGPYRFVDREYLIFTYRSALALFPHALAPVAELPVLEVVSAVHILTDLTLPLGAVAYDYLVA